MRLALTAASDGVIAWRRMSRGTPLGPPAIGALFLFFFLVGRVPLRIKKGTLILTSLLEDLGLWLCVGPGAQTPGNPSGESLRPNSIRQNQEGVALGPETPGLCANLQHHSRIDVKLKMRHLGNNQIASVVRSKVKSRSVGLLVSQWSTFSYDRRLSILTSRASVSAIDCDTQPEV